jgi:hypothetical protein
MHLVRQARYSLCLVPSDLQQVVRQPNLPKSYNEDAMDAASPLKPLTGERLQALLLAVGASPNSSKKRTRDEVELDNEAYLSGEEDVEDEDILVPTSKRVSDTPSDYACKHCSKSFRRRSDRERHERTHTGERYARRMADLSMYQLKEVAIKSTDPTSANTARRDSSSQARCRITKEYIQATSLSFAASATAPEAFRIRAALQGIANLTLVGPFLTYRDDIPDALYHMPDRTRYVCEHCPGKSYARRDVGQPFESSFIMPIFYPLAS